MLEIRLKTVLLKYSFLHGTKEILIAGDGPAALGALQMVVMTLMVMVVNKLITLLTFIDTAGLFQDIQCTVDRRLIHAGHLRLNTLYYLICGYMALSLMDNIGDKYPLGSKFKTFSLQGWNATHGYCTLLQL